MTKHQATACWAAGTAWVWARTHYRFADERGRVWLCWMEAKHAVQRALRGVA